MQSPNGSIAGPPIGTVSLSPVYGGSGSGVKLGGTDWITVSCIRFNTVNTRAVQSNCFGLRRQIDTAFPVTGLSEVISNNNTLSIDAYVTRSGGVFQNLIVNPTTDRCHTLGSTDTNELMIPEGFLPNGDGINDRSFIHRLGSLKADVTIFNVSDESFTPTLITKMIWMATPNKERCPMKPITPLHA